MNRYLILPLVLIITFGITFFLPGQGNLQTSAISMELPVKLNGWKGYPLQPSLQERNTLSKDTLFRKMDYWRLGNPKDHYSFVPDNVKIHLSVVFSGHDVNNSIHRPERCMPAQGHFDMTSRDFSVPVEDLEVSIPIKRLSSKQKIHLMSADKEGGETEFELDSVTYYFFVGHSALSNSHTERTILDVKDRLLKGYDQRWAFVSMSMPFGEHPYPHIGNLSEEEADEILTTMVASLAKEAISWDQIERGVLLLINGQQ